MRLKVTTDSALGFPEKLVVAVVQDSELNIAIGCDRIIMCYFPLTLIRSTKFRDDMEVDHGGESCLPYR